MVRSRGWIPGLIAAAALVAVPWGAPAADDDDMKACAAVTSTAVRLACFDAAAKDVKEGDVAACAQVSADSVRLACFDAAAGSSPAHSSAPAASADRDITLPEEEMRKREAEMNARIKRLQQKAAEVERRAAEIERKAAAVNGKKGERVEPEKEADEHETFGDREAEYDDPLTAERYGKEERTKKREDSDRVNEIRVKIVKVEEGPLGKLKVTLENGQVWKQIDNDRARWKRNGENHAKISRAFLGSFLMTINDQGPAIRVRRVK